MKRLFTFWRHYAQIPKEARTFIEQHARVHQFEKNSYYIESIEVQHYWCFVLEGLVAEYSTSLSGRQILDWITVANNYYTGTKHPFTSRNYDTKIQFLLDTKIVQIPNHIIQFGQKEFPSISELLHTLKQKKITRSEKMLYILRQDTKSEQLIAFLTMLPDTAKTLTVLQVCEFLNIDRTTYYRGLKEYYSRK